MKKKIKLGFALLSKAERSAIASRGGIAAHKAGTAHKFTKHTASLAGQKGGRRAARNAK